MNKKPKTRLTKAEYMQYLLNTDFGKNATMQEYINALNAKNNDTK